MNTLEFVVIAIAIIFLLLSNLHNIYKQNKQIAFAKKLRKDIDLIMLDLGFNVDCSLADAMKYCTRITRRDNKKERDSKLYALDHRFARAGYDEVTNIDCCKPAYKPTDGIADPNANKPTADLKAKQDEVTDTGSFSFGTAIEYLKQGKMVTRKGWNGKGMFLFMRPGDSLPVRIIPDLVSIPPIVKDYIKNFYVNGIKVKFTPYICMKAADGSIVNGWLASQTDMLADDWEQQFFTYK